MLAIWLQLTSVKKTKQKGTEHCFLGIVHFLPTEYWNNSFLAALLTNISMELWALFFAYITFSHFVMWPFWVRFCMSVLLLHLSLIIWSSSFLPITLRFWIIRAFVNHQLVSYYIYFPLPSVLKQFVFVYQILFLWEVPSCPEFFLEFDSGKKKPFCRRKYTSVNSVKSDALFTVLRFTLTKNDQLSFCEHSQLLCLPSSHSLR